MCIKAVEIDPSFLQLVPDHLKMQYMCNEAVRDDSSSLQFVPDWFITQQQIDLWYDDKCFEWYDDGKDKFVEFTDDGDNFFDWHDGYQKRKAQKAQKREELLPIAWHPSRHWDWFMSEDDKKEIGKLWA